MVDRGGPSWIVSPAHPVLAVFFTHTLTQHTVTQHCYSCMSREYMRMWTVLMHTYYPPKDFTDTCDMPARAHWILKSAHRAV